VIGHLLSGAPPACGQETQINGAPGNEHSWHQVATVSDHFHSESVAGAIQEICLLTVAFHDGTLDKVLNEVDEVEFALLA
jgi:hypothetical protein